MVALFLIAAHLFPGPPHPMIVSQMVIEYYMANEAFKEEYGMTDINTVQVYMRGGYGLYLCGDGVMRKGYPIRVQVHFIRGSPFKTSTMFRVFMFVGKDKKWEMFYSPRLRFEDILHGKRIKV